MGSSQRRNITDCSRLTIVGGHVAPAEHHFATAQVLSDSSLGPSDLLDVRPDAAAQRRPEFEGLGYCYLASCAYSWVKRCAWQQGSITGKIGPVISMGSVIVATDGVDARIHTEFHARSAGRDQRAYRSEPEVGPGKNLGASHIRAPSALDRA